MLLEVIMNVIRFVFGAVEVLLMMLLVAPFIIRFIKWLSVKPLDKLICLSVMGGVCFMFYSLICGVIIIWG